MVTATATVPTGVRLKDKVCIVTGSSSGLGRAVALAFAAQGTHLVVCADLKYTPKSDFMAEEAGTPTEEVICRRYGEKKGIFVKTDVTVGTEVEALVQAAAKAGGRLDIMVNNAGIGGTENHGMVHEMTEETWDNVMNINSRSVFLGCKYACAQFMNQAPHESGHRGWIINTSSIMGLVGQAVYGAAYCASKGAVTLLTKQIAVEYAKHKIHCNCVCPGHLRTPMTQDQYQDREMRTAISTLTPWGDEWGAAEDVAKGYVYLASDDAAYVTGVALPIDGGYCAQ
ncbi:hypothetical protein IMSHALPRED_011023 [Imshaugia aleurites]|uniref:Uncharacterized protein n=1 Tax=Imshaugia aleurites TaxID=172621 RepID=A0A8H3GC04_9LECA|nr:hypothetical protein IMSHALPRED_011023 [Imshaugia aleurites]